MSAAPLFDTHNHLLFGELGEDPEGAWSRARQAGVGRAVLIGIDADSAEAVAAHAACREGLYAAVGIHPNETAAADEASWERIVALLEQPKVVALGETGLDLYWKRVPLARQVEWLERHAEAALDADLPLVLHLRDAWPPARETLASFAARGLRAVLHCFGGTAADLDPFLDWGWPVSFAGNLTYPGARALRQAAARVPLEQLLVETDAPWLAPVPCRGKVNEPAYLVHTARRLAEVLGRTYEEVAEATSHNALRFFRIEP